MLNAMQPFGSQSQFRTLNAKPRFAAEQATVPATKESECHSATASVVESVQQCYKEHHVYYQGGALVIATLLLARFGKLTLNTILRLFQKD